MTKVKICGITNLRDAEYCVSCGVDFLGFIFTQESPRFISPAQAQKITRRISQPVRKVGVFVNEEPRRVKEIVRACGLDLLQFHGEETPAYCEAFRDSNIIKAVRVENGVFCEDLKRYGNILFLFDTFKAGALGGTGVTFDWGLLEAVKSAQIPFFVSGGLNPDNVSRLVGQLHPFGVDVASGVEVSAGKKDHKLVKEFIDRVRSNDK